MKLTDTKLKSLKPRPKSYQVSDGNGLFIEVMPGGKKVWRLRYRFRDRQEKVTLGGYPSYSLLAARKWREECRESIGRGDSPMQIRRSEKEQAKSADTVSAFSERWLSEVVSKDVKNPQNIERALNKDILPEIGNKKLAEVTTLDVLAITDRIKARGADHMALVTRNIIKRMYAYAISRRLARFNPAAEVEAKYIAQHKSREVALTPKEVGEVIRTIYASSKRRSHKLALHLLLLTMIRKSEMINAKWEEIDFEKGEFAIPGERMKMGKPHIVYLSRQAQAMLEELFALSSGSAFVFPSCQSLRKSICPTTLNASMRSMTFSTQKFVIHDFRRTASTQMNETGFNADVIEKCLAHDRKDIRGVYNRAEYADQRRELLQWWADFVDAQIDDQGQVILGRFGGLRQAAG
jgi:integrase